MRGFERKLITEWRRLQLPVGDAVVVAAVSGGADSLSLLLATDELRKLGKLELRIVAAHFNHKLRGEESDADESFVRDVCTERRVELAVGHSRSKPESNIEQAARLERYEFLRTTAQSVRATHVLTAHTVDDQAETFLLNLIRGSGIQGLSGMKPIRDLAENDSSTKLVRPLLGWARRSDTETYCLELGAAYRSDTMNEDEAFTRVRVRKILLPLLRDFNPKIVERLAETARLLSLEIGDSTEKFAGDLELKRLSNLPEAELNKVLRTWLAGHRGDLKQIGLKHIEAVRRLVNSRKSGKTVELPGGSTVSRKDGMLVFNKNNVEKGAPDP
jgi:tRNA(Ile)-lysidine synthase